MIRGAEAADVPEILDVVVAAELFSREESVMVGGLFEEYFGGEEHEGHGCVLWLEGAVIVAVAYFKPIRTTEGVWDLTMLAVRPEGQRRGHGAALMAHIEELLKANAQRLLLVETSGTAAYEKARSFYAKVGYDQEARVRDYWSDGDDMVLFRKDLQLT